jgi:kinesin family protein 6/9
MDSDDDGTERGAGAGGPEDGAIGIYLRVKPVANPTTKVEYDPQDGKLVFHVPKDAVWGSVNNTREKYEFTFNAVFGPEATQDDVFTAVGRRPVLGCLDGYNGTVFAYGQARRCVFGRVETGGCLSHLR